MKKWFKRIFLSLLLVFAGLQLVPVDRGNPPVDSAKALHTPPEVEAILRASCYDCHSNETRWPWYTYVAPLSWWIANHIHAGRRKLNFSTWTTLPSKRQADELGRMQEQIMEGKMPLPSYLIMHAETRISPVQDKILSDWSNTTLLQLYSATPTPAAH